MSAAEVLPKYIFLGLGFLVFCAMAVFALVVFPRIAWTFDRRLPTRPSRIARFVPTGKRYDSPRALAQVRFSGYILIFNAAFLAVLIMWSAIQDIETFIHVKR